MEPINDIFLSEVLAVASKVFCYLPPQPGHVGGMKPQMHANARRCPRIRLICVCRRASAVSLLRCLPFVIRDDYVTKLDDGVLFRLGKYLWPHVVNTRHSLRQGLDQRRIPGLEAAIDYKRCLQHGVISFKVWFP